LLPRASAVAVADAFGVWTSRSIAQFAHVAAPKVVKHLVPKLSSDNGSSSADIIAPRFTPVAWGVMVGFIAVYLLGSLSGLPQWLLNLEPFAHILWVSGGSFSPAPPLLLLAIDAAL
jgi:hypothetical protein